MKTFEDIFEDMNQEKRSYDEVEEWRAPGEEILDKLHNAYRVISEVNKAMSGWYTYKSVTKKARVLYEDAVKLKLDEGFLLRDAIIAVLYIATRIIRHDPYALKSIPRAKTRFGDFAPHASSPDELKRCIESFMRIYTNNSYNNNNKIIDRLGVNLK